MKRVCTRKLQGSLTITSLALAMLLALIASNARAQDGEHTFSKDVPEQTVTFPTVNPYTNVSGSMTIVFAGVFHAIQKPESKGLEISRITGRQKGTFTFFPDDSSQPTISGRFHFNFAGQPQPRSNAIDFAFRMTGKSSDGFLLTFLQSERAIVSEEGVVISFGKTEAIAVAPNN